MPVVLTRVYPGTNERITFPLSPAGEFLYAPCPPLTLSLKPEWTEGPIFLEAGRRALHVLGILWGTWMAILTSCHNMA